MQNRNKHIAIKVLAFAVLAGLSASAAAQDASAQSNDDSSNASASEGSGWKVSWTNTFKYTAGFRVRDQDPALVTGGGNAANYDDGDRNFNKGLVSDRLDLLSELDVTYNDRFGARVSGAAWYDTVYNTSNDNPGFAGGAVPNQSSVDYDQFVHSARRLSGRQAEIRDAFVFGKFGDEYPLDVRLGQHSVMWGESLFFAANAIAGAQNAFDIGRLLADPTAQAKEFVLPVPQVSAQMQIGDATIAAYYQFDWRENRFPAVGSYFSSSDIFGPSAEHMWVGPGASVNRLDDIEPEHGKQGGVSVRFNAANTDFGVYALRFDDHTPQLITTLGFSMGANGPTPVPDGFVQTYHQGTNLFGASASHTFGNANVAIEASIHDHASLGSSGGAADMHDFYAGLQGFLTSVGDPGAAYVAVPPAADNDDHPAYAVGKTAHVNLNTIWTPSPNALFQESSFVAEVAWNRMLSCDVNCKPTLDANGNVVGPAALDPNGTRDGLAGRFVFTPMYRQAFSGLDLSVPFGVGFSPRNSRPLAIGPGVFPAAGGGDMTLGINGLYNATWNVTLQYTHYYGRADTLLSSQYADASAPPYTWGNTLLDRDFVSFIVKRSF